MPVRLLTVREIGAGSFLQMKKPAFNGGLFIREDLSGLKFQVIHYVANGGERGEHFVVKLNVKLFFADNHKVGELKGIKA